MNSVRAQVRRRGGSERESTVPSAVEVAVWCARNALDINTRSTGQEELGYDVERVARVDSVQRHRDRGVRETVAGSAVAGFDGDGCRLGPGRDHKGRDE